MQIEFSKSIQENIEATFTYSFASNAYGYNGQEVLYNPIDFFTTLLKIENPFFVFMELERFGFKRAKQAIERYDIPYTPEQERKAKIFTEITDQMQLERSDVVSNYLSDWEGTGIVRVGDGYNFTTVDTLSAESIIQSLNPYQLTDNLIDTESIPPLIKKSSEQMNALKLCLRHKVTCLIGGAGTGKSFLTAEIIRQLINNRKHLAVLAPTHKAREALQSKLTANVTVRTIHSFAHSHESKEYDVVVIDESGMLSTPLFVKLMRQLEPTTQLIFVGDKNQLPPIDYGRPFEKLQTICPIAELKANHRSEAPDIVMLGREILGQAVNENIVPEHIEQVDSIKEAFNRGADVLITFTNANVKEANEQQRIKNGEQSIYPDYSIGDKIVATTNKRGRFYNGELYTIISWDQIKNDLTGRELKIKSPYELKNNFNLAYALTIHKSQGSEWDTVAYLPSPMDTQNLAYVAVTRAKKKLIIVGQTKESYPPEREWQHI